MTDPNIEIVKENLVQAKAQLAAIADATHKIEELSAAINEQVALISTHRDTYLEAVHQIKTRGVNDPACHFSCVKSRFMDSIAMRMRTASQQIIGIGADLRRRAP